VSNLRRVPKSEAQTKFKAADPVDICLECWKTWMHGDSDRDLGAKTMGGLVANSDGYGCDSSEAQQKRDTAIAVATDACIDSLKRIHIWAIYKTCSIGQIWSFPNADLASTYESARKELEPLLRKNPATSSEF
jgi:hypothetical protein